MTKLQKPSPDRDSMRVLRKLNARFIHNFVTNDVASHDALLHPDFISISSNGMRLDRKSYLERWANLFDPGVITYWDVRDELITVIGNLGLVRATNKHVERHGDKEITGMTSYTDTYICEHGSWKCIQAQLTPVEPAYFPSDDSIISIYDRGIRVQGNE